MGGAWGGEWVEPGEESGWGLGTSNCIVSEEV